MSRMKAIELYQKLAMIIEDYGPDIELQTVADGHRLSITSCDVDSATEDMPTQSGLAIILS